MTEKVIIAGAGGQGIMLLGKILAEAAMREERFVTWLPAYGAEVRGGTAYCMVVISDTRIGSPFIACADTLIIMNNPSLLKFRGRLKAQGLLIVNGSLIARNAKVPQAAYQCPFTEQAIALGNIKVANMIALGFYIGKKGVVKPDTVREVITASAPAGRHELIAINHQALKEGIGCAHGKS